MFNFCEKLLNHVRVIALFDVYFKQYSETIGLNSIKVGIIVFSSVLQKMTTGIFICEKNGH